MTDPTTAAPPTVKQYFTSSQFQWSLVIAGIAIFTSSLAAAGAYASGTTDLHTTLGVVIGAVLGSITILGQGINDAARNFAGNVQPRDVTPN